MEKALSVKNPWAQLIVWGLKDVENRPMKTNFRGRVLIHSSAIPDKRFKEGIPDYMTAFQSLAEKKIYFNHPKNYRNGYILGSVEIVDCVQNHPSIWAEEGCWHWVLANPEIGSKWDGYRVKGSLGLWKMNQSKIMEELTKQKIEEMVNSIKIDPENFKKISESGKIQGELITEIWRVILEGWKIGTGYSACDNELLNFINSHKEVKEMLVQLKNTFENLESGIIKTSSNG